jgi:DnaJ-class molecular chaperone
MSVFKVEIDCVDCNGDGWTVPYGPNGYEAQEKCETCNGKKKIMVDEKFARMMEGS